MLTSLPLQAGGSEVGINPMYALIGLLIVVLVAIGAAYWVYKDASKRDNNELAWAIGVGVVTFLIPLIGIGLLVLYLILRGDERTTEPMRDGPSDDEW